VPVTAHDLAFVQQRPDRVVALKWEEIAAGLPRLSSLVSPLYNTAQECDVIYLVLDSMLIAVPFVALAFGDGTTLIDHCAIAYAPPATVLAQCLSQRSNSTGHSCLAVARGTRKDDDAVLFAQRAEQIAGDAAWHERASTLINEEATKERVLSESKDFSVIHVTCHGHADPNAADTLRGSNLELADGDLSAYEVYEHYERDQLRAELVFLDACETGAIVHPFGSEVGGFWHVFLRAGISSLIATLVAVDKGAAGKIATRFYFEWLHNGHTKAEALRQAQLHIRAQKGDPYYWATHVLVGDYR
jgi:CHAT domain-containing protein